MNSSTTPSSSGNSSRARAHTSFLVVAGILLFSAVAFNGFVWNLKLHFKKEAVPQPREFSQMPPLMGHWLQVSQDDKLDKEMEDVLGTENYLYRDYVQVDRAGADLVAFVAARLDVTSSPTKDPATDGAAEADAEAARAKFNAATFDQQVKMINDCLKNKTSSERKAIVTSVEMRGHAGDVVHLGLTYYTGLVDTVAHIPDRCYIADGYEPNSYTQPTWQLGPDSTGKAMPLDVRFINFQDSTGNNRVSKCVAYVFHTNGHYDSDPLGVRRTLENLSERYGYYAKIELMTLGEDTDVASAAMTDFLTVARPQIESCFPDWQKLKHSHA